MKSIDELIRYLESKFKEWSEYKPDITDLIDKAEWYAHKQAYGDALFHAKQLKANMEAERN
jgi:hypothetical protein